MSVRTHDYTHRTCGHDYCIHGVEQNGVILRTSGWGGGILRGDYLTLPNDGASTRYRVTDIWYFSDPPDMWMADLEFAPRQDRTDE
jgi:hypothetical protein